ncbi:unnamed protein product [Prunus brigantina]
MMAADKDWFYVKGFGDLLVLDISKLLASSSSSKSPRPEFNRVHGSSHSERRNLPRGMAYIFVDSKLYYGGIGRLCNSNRTFPMASAPNPLVVTLKDKLYPRSVNEFISHPLGNDMGMVFQLLVTSLAGGDQFLVNAHIKAFESYYFKEPGDPCLLPVALRLGRVDKHDNKADVSCKKENLPEFDRRGKEGAQSKPTSPLPQVDSSAAAAHR